MSTDAAKERVLHKRYYPTLKSVKAIPVYLDNVVTILSSLLKKYKDLQTIEIGELLEDLNILQEKLNSFNNPLTNSISKYIVFYIEDMKDIYGILSESDGITREDITDIFSDLSEIKENINQFKYGIKTIHSVLRSLSYVKK